VPPTGRSGDVDGHKPQTIIPLDARSQSFIGGVYHRHHPLGGGPDAHLVSAGHAYRCGRQHHQPGLLHQLGHRPARSSMSWCGVNDALADRASSC
jgi:hypothetical protein